MTKQNLEKYLQEGNCFKLICGAGNQNFDEIKKLCVLYSSAGCKFFDVNASVEAIKSAKNGIELGFSKKEQEKYYICVSVGTKNDPHFSKYKINKDKCILCKKCEEICIQKAIKDGYIEENKCIGCAKCTKVCPKNAFQEYSKRISLEKILPDIIAEGIDCIEFHIITDDETEIFKDWEIITNLYKGPISVCLDRSNFGNKKMISVLKRLKETCRNLFIIQADGSPMSGGQDDYASTLQAVAAAEIIIKANISDYIFISGGTNSKSKELADLCSINITGVAMGSFARKAVKEYIEKSDFLDNKDMFNTALNIAKSITAVI